MPRAYQKPFQKVLNLKLDKKKKSIRNKRETISKPFQKVLNLKLDIPNLFLVYSPLMKSRIKFDQNNSEEDKERIRLARLSAQALTSL